MSWPTHTQVGAALVARGLVTVSPGSAVLDPILAGLQQEFQMKTGWAFLIQEGSDSTVAYRDPNDTLEYALPGYTAITQVKSGESVLVLDEGYELLPQNAPAMGMAWQMIRLLSPIRGWLPLTVTGRRGRFVTIPADVQAAAIGAACSRWVSQYMTAAHSEAQTPIKRRKDGPVEEEAAISIAGDTLGTIGGSVTVWDREWEKVIARYKRQVFV